MSLPFLQQAQKRMTKPFTLVQADVSAMPFEDACFDAIVCGGSLNEMLDLPACLAELARVLKPGGRMWQMYLRRAEGPLGRLLQGLLRLSGIRFIEPDELKRMAQSQGLSLTKAQYRGVVVMALFEKPLTNNVPA
jgi:2-polyprenyl-6-hydroxyphenyl methylase/3-demethylubiquinone-9 3-methyltransferase